jgi:hypothetical protein
MFPWAPADVGRWDALLWSTGRRELTGRPSFADRSWPWLSTPIDQWDGVTPSGEEPLAPAFVLDEASGVWEPVDAG